MRPILFTLNLFGHQMAVKSYSFFLVLALIVAIVGIYFLLKKQGWSARSALFLLSLTGVSSFIGARLLHFLTNINFYQKNPGQIFSLSFAGFSIFGGILFATLTAFIVCKVFKKDFWRAGDAAAIMLGISIAITRVGCFLNGCCYGHETETFFGVKFPMFSYAHQYQLANGLSSIFKVLPVHPTELYELVAALIGSLLAYLVYRKKKAPGLAILTFAIWFCAFRWFNYYLRVPPATFDAPEWFYPLFYGVLITSCLGIIAIKLKIKKTAPSEIQTEKATN
jgi:phosphatidylglycerol---prolipoprotein diacylglyceryl transferase